MLAFSSIVWCWLKSVFQQLGSIKDGSCKGFYIPWARKSTELGTSQTREEMSNSLAAAEPGSRLRGLVLLLRYSGLRIGDAVTLGWDRLNKGKLLLSIAKTGVQVYPPLPEFVVDALEAIAVRGEYFFWTGTGTKKSVTT